MPVTPVVAMAASKPGSSDHRSDPITRNRGSLVSGSISTRSIAPGAARWPELIWAPSNAGPVGEEQASTRVLLPNSSSALVPTSTIRTISSDLPGSSASATAAASAPTCPAIQGRMNTRAAGFIAVRFSSVAFSESEFDVAKANGAWPNSTGSIPSSRWCMIGLQTNTTSIRSRASIPAWAVSSKAKLLIASRTAVVISTSPPGFIMA